MGAGHDENCDSDPLGPVLDRMRRTAEQARQDRVTKSGAPRAGWTEVAADFALGEDDRLAWPEFGNDGDAALKW
jgi:hypothetical protein